MTKKLLCGCGKPLHYTDKSLQKKVQALVDQLGEFIPVQVIGTTSCYLVPRHFIALHGLKAVELVNLAEKYGWRKEVK